MHITRTALCPLLLLVGGLSLTQLASGSVPIQISIQSTLQQPDKQKVGATTPPSFPGGEEALRAYLEEHTVYPEEAQKQKIQGQVRITFIVQPDGQISDIAVAQGAALLLDREALRVVRSMPRWVPARREGVAVAAPMMLPIIFKLPSQGLASLVDHLQKSNVKQVAEPDSIPVIDENNTDIERPLFPGGDQGLSDFLRLNLEYPDVEYRNRTQGEVHLRFVVDVDGSISQVTVVKGTSPAFEQAALDVMKLAPKFIPARKNGKPLQAWHYMAIRFFPR